MNAKYTYSVHFIAGNTQTLIVKNSERAIIKDGIVTIYAPNNIVHIIPLSSIRNIIKVPNKEKEEI